MGKLTLTIHTAWLPKRGHAPEEYEDAFAVSPPSLPLRAAIADGATESAFSGGWARALVEEYVAPTPDRETPSLETAAAAVDRAGALLGAIERARVGWSPPEDPRWYVAAKTAEGAHAAMLGLQISANGDYHAESVGDCCLFLIRERRLTESWPMDNPDAFSHHPDLISSRSSDPPSVASSRSGTWRVGDTFLLATDALAAWLLEREMVPDPADDLLARARASGMRNDDATLVVISMVGNPPRSTA